VFLAVALGDKNKQRVNEAGVVDGRRRSREGERRRRRKKMRRGGGGERERERERELRVDGRANKQWRGDSG